MFGMYPDPLGYLASHEEDGSTTPPDTGLVSLLAAVAIVMTLAVLIFVGR